MAEKIKMTGLVSRQTLFADEQYLALLEHSSTSDTIRRIHYDQIQSITVWKTVAWLPLVLVFLFLALPGMASMSIGSGVMMIPGGVITLIALLAMAWYAYCRKTHMTLVRDGQVRTYHFIVRPGRVNRFVLFMVSRINEIQRANHQAQSPDMASTNEPHATIDDNNGTETEPTTDMEMPEPTSDSTF